jgi:hypothetical protein
MKKSHSPYQQSSPSHGKFITLIAPFVGSNVRPPHAAADAASNHPVLANPEGGMTKIATILSLLLDGYSFNRFEVEPIGDHCLHSTISTLANDYGLTFVRTPEQVPNRFGGETRVVRYSLPPFERDLANKVFSMLKKRGRP